MVRHVPQTAAFLQCTERKATDVQRQWSVGLAAWLPAHGGAWWRGPAGQRLWWVVRAGAIRSSRRGHCRPCEWWFEPDPQDRANWHRGGRGRQGHHGELQGQASWGECRGYADSRPRL